MNIGIYEQRTGSKPGGTETFVRKTISYLSKNTGHDITLYTQKGKILSELREFDIDIVQINALKKDHNITRFLSKNTWLKSAEIGSLSMYLNAYRQGIIEDLERKEDVVSTHYYLDNILISRSVGIPKVFRFPGIKQKSIRWKTMFYLSDTDLYIANSDSTRKRVKKFYDIDIEDVVYPGLRKDKFLQNGRRETDNLTILFVGRLDRGKGIFDLLRAYSEIDTDKPTTLRIVGDGNLRQKIQEKTNELGISKDTEIVGSIPHRKIPKEYRNADIFCLPSYHESFGLTNIEAMLSGLPVISTRIDAIQEYIDDAECGFLVEPGNIEELRVKLRLLIEDKELRQKFGKKGGRNAEKYTVEKSAKQMEKIYKKAVEVSEK